MTIFQEYLSNFILHKIVEKLQYFRIDLELFHRKNSIIISRPTIKDSTSKLTRISNRIWNIRGGKVPSLYSNR